MIKSDLMSYHLKIDGLVKGLFTGHAFYAVLLYRIGNWMARHHIKFFPDVIKFYLLRKYACEISPYATIGAPFKLHHTPGIVIGHEVIMGDRCEVFQNVTIGSNRKERGGRFMPIIGDDCSIGAGAVVVGAISIGNNVKIGANSYVSCDVPDDAVVAGNPARIVRRTDAK